MNGPQSGYTRKQWFWAVNLIALMGGIGFILPMALRSPGATPLLLAYGIVVALIISWVLIALPLAYAMKTPATWTRAALWGGAVASTLAALGFVIVQIRRWQIQTSPNSSSQLGGGDYIREVNGVLTPYGWWIVVQNNALFVLLGVGVALIVRAILGPGQSPGK